MRESSSAWRAWGPGLQADSAAGMHAVEQEEIPTRECDRVGPMISVSDSRKHDV